jgi:cobalamin biosynthesis protein CobT
MRVAFADNARGKDVYHLKSGKINGKVLGKRAPGGDERLFRKKIMPGKRDYFVLLGLDISGSTVGRNIALIKAAAHAQAELLARMGIKFAIYAHSGNIASSALESDPSMTWARRAGLDLDIYHVKDPDEPWDVKIQERLDELGPDSANLDGHSLEFYRKRCDERQETDKIILYYSDGKMPAENYEEELEILQREIRICRQKKYTLLGVGIRTDSPRAHGLDTVQIDEISEIGQVVRHLEKVLR